ncbi:MAG: hypothetical protein GC182_18105 [Rhodopseudomonas sp.]|nr:hypothetical protein [Rhodopseudomonas sp.]
MRRVARTISQLLAAGPGARGRSPGAARARGIRRPPPAGSAPGSVFETPRGDLVLTLTPWARRLPARAANRPPWRRPLPWPWPRPPHAWRRCRPK